MVAASPIQRKISTSKYVVAAIITSVIFLFGLTLGLVVEKSQVSFIERQVKWQQTEFSSLQTQYLYLEQLARDKDCTGIGHTFERAVKNLDESRVRLESFEQHAKVSKEDFDLLRRDYAIAQIRFWLLSERKTELCGGDAVSVLYFYSTKEECPECENQAFVLTYLKKKFDGQILIFSLDGKDSEEPLVDLLKDTYGIDTYPSVVVGNITFRGFTSKEKLLGEVCSSYGNVTDCLN